MKLNDAPWLEQQYNNRARVPDHPQYLERWARTSAQVRASEPCSIDVAYGRSPGERLDVFPSARPEGPVLVFIHGGYWRSLDKSDHSFIAPAFTRKGACLVVPNYDLCPAATVPGIVMQMVRALAWTAKHIASFGADPGRITVAGHSAGGHLAAMMLACDWTGFDAKLPARLVERALSISGLYELEPLRFTPSLQVALQLTESQVLQASPARLPAPASGTLYTVAGGRESMEFLRQNELIRQAWGTQRVPVCEALPGLNHFSVLDALVEEGSRLNRLAWELLSGR